MAGVFAWRTSYATTMCQDFSLGQFRRAHKLSSCLLEFFPLLLVEPLRYLDCCWHGHPPQFALNGPIIALLDGLQDRKR